MQSTLIIQSRGYTTRTGYSGIDDVLDRCAVLYNAALQHRRDAWQQTQESVSYYDQFREVTGLRQDDPYWEALSVQVARGVIMRAQRAYDGFFRRVRRGETPGYPRFKPRSRYKTVEVTEVSPSMLKVRGSGLLMKIKGLPTIHIYPSRELPPLEQARSLQITRRNPRNRREYPVCLYAESPSVNRSDNGAGPRSCQKVDWFRWVFVQPN